MSPRKKNSPRYVTADECARVSGDIRRELSILKKALVGDDMRGGIVKDVQDIKNTLKTASSVANFVKPVVVAVLSAIITALILSFL